MVSKAIAASSLVLAACGNLQTRKRTYNYSQKNCDCANRRAWTAEMLGSVKLVEKTELKLNYSSRCIPQTNKANCRMLADWTLSNTTTSWTTTKKQKDSFVLRYLYSPIRPLTQVKTKTYASVEETQNNGEIVLQMTTNESRALYLLQSAGLRLNWCFPGTELAPPQTSNKEKPCKSRTLSWTLAKQLVHWLQLMSCCKQYSLCWWSRNDYESTLFKEQSRRKPSNTVQTSSLQKALGITTQSWCNQEIIAALPHWRKRKSHRRNFNGLIQLGIKQEVGRDFSTSCFLRFKEKRTSTVADSS